MSVRDCSALLIRLKEMLQNIQTGGGFKVATGGVVVVEVGGGRGTPLQPLLVVSRWCLIETPARGIKHGRVFGLISNLS